MTIENYSNLVMHDIYKRLGNNNMARANVYQALCNIEIGKDVIKDIQQASSFSMSLGDSRFQKQIEEMLGRKFGNAKRGRPFKSI